MPKTRILLVDDAIVVRRLLSDAISEDPTLEVVGTAANGRIALAKIPQVKPDLIVMDVEMPEMDGLQTLAAIRKIDRKLPVIMFSSLTQRGASATLEALAQGANDYVTKPSNTGSFEAAQKNIRDQLLPKIKQWCKGNCEEARHQAASPPSPTKTPFAAPRMTRIDVLAVGVSTGGPNTLASIVSKLPVSFPVPIVIVQHMPPVFTGLLASRLASVSRLKVNEAKEGTRLEPGQIWIAPGDYHVVIQSGGFGPYLHLHQEPLENSCRPAVDVLFRSIASVYGKNSLGLILTGMGQDGLRGCEAIKNAGGTIYVQDRDSSVVWGMPGQVARAGLAHGVYSLTELVPALLQRIAMGRSMPELKLSGGGVKS